MGMFKAAVQSGTLSIISNIAAQLITAWQTGSPWTLNITQLLQFLSFSVLACPPNYIWQTFLEAQFPAYTTKLSPQEKEALVDDAVVSGESTGVDASTRKRVQDKALIEKKSAVSEGSKGKEKQLSIRNTAIKFTLDQTLGAAVNTVLFIAGIAFLRGQSSASAFRDVQEQFWPMIFAGQKLWPAVSLLSFTVIPLEHRMLFGSVAGLFWGIYLSLIAGS